MQILLNACCHRRVLTFPIREGIIFNDWRGLLPLKL